MKITLLLLLTLFFTSCGSSSNEEHSSFRVSDISPLIDINDTYIIEENTREAFQVKATDNSNLKYYISGKDAYLLYIDTITGELFFKEPTNYEKKFTYSFILIVEDSVGNRATKNITIKIKKGKKSSPIPTVDTPKRAFITIWKTDNEGISQNNQITIPTLGDGYDYTVEWGDGSKSTNLTLNATHTYEEAGTYTIKITGKFPRIYFDKKDDNKKLLSIQQWGDNEWKSMGGAFQNCSNMIINATDSPNLSHVTDMHRMFAYCNSLNQNIGNWDVSHITNMSSMFIDTKFNQDISSWNVSHVTNMSAMFILSEFNQDISSWDVSRVTDMSYMFNMTNQFNQNINTWDVSHVINMNGIFQMTSKFNQDIDSWDVSSVTTMQGMFEFSKKFNQDISSWDLSHVTNMSCMFKDTKAFNQNISPWDVFSVTNMNSMFYNARAFKQQNLHSWDVRRVTPDAHKNFFTGAGEGNIEPHWRE